MKKTFFIHFILLLVLNFVVKPFWVFGIDRTVQNTVGAEAYGTYFSLLNFSLVFNFILDLGLRNFNQRNIARENELISVYLPNILTLKIILSVFYIFLSVGIAYFLKYNPNQIKWLYFLLLNQVLLSFIHYFRSNLSGLHFFKSDIILSVADRFIMVLIFSFLLWAGTIQKPFRIEWFIYGQTIAYFGVCMLGFAMTLKKSVTIKWRIDVSQIFLILKQSFPYALLILLMTSYLRIDAVMLERMLHDGGKQAGIYAQSFRLFDAVSMYGFLISGLLLPMFSRMFKKEEPVSDLVNFSFVLLFVPVSIFVIATIGFNEEAMQLLYKEHTAVSSRVLVFLLVGLLANSMSYIFGTLLTANGSLRMLNKIAFGGFVVNISLNSILIPSLQAEGAAIASCITLYLVLILQIIYTFRIIPIHIQPGILSRLVGFIISLALLYFILTNTELHWTYAYLVFCFTAGITSLLLRIIKWKEITALLKEN